MKQKKFEALLYSAVGVVVMLIVVVAINLIGSHRLFPARSRCP